MLYLLGGTHWPPMNVALAAVLFWTLVPLLFEEYSVSGNGGKVLLFASVLVRWWAFRFIPPDASNQLLALLIATQVVPRAAMIGLAWISRPAAGGPVNYLAATMSSVPALFAMLQAIIAVTFCGWRFAVVAMASAYVVVNVVRKLSYRRAGGVDANGLGIVRQLLEVLLLLALSVLTPVTYL